VQSCITLSDIAAHGRESDRTGDCDALLADRVHVEWPTDPFDRHASNRDQFIVAEW
jgi:hypothetical protein